MTTPAILNRPDGTAIAYHHSPGASPGVLFCGGFKSDMSGIKATSLEAHCRARGRQYTRFDYRGHGESGGDFIAACLGDWRGDALAVLDRVSEGPQIIVGSSMGGWIMLLLALARPARTHALVGIAPAPDFVIRMADSLDDDARRQLRQTGVYRRPSQYADEPYEITQHLLDEGRQHLVMQGPIAIQCPVRLLHGMRDPDVPWELSLELAGRLASDDIEIVLVKDGDHRLSEPADIARLLATVDGLCGAP